MIRYQNFQLIKNLGEGVSGRCFLAKSLLNKELCVIKQISLQGIQQQSIQKTERQVKILQMLKHPNIIQLRSSFIKDNSLNIVMDYAQGGDLQNKVRNSKSSFTESQILQWFIQICLALKKVHQNKIIHRDIKCQNIFLTNDGKIKLGDFGISKPLNLTLEKIKSVVGTPYYMSPQICENLPYSYKTDIWSLGVVLYQMCTLRLPFQAQSLAGLVMKICKGYFRQIPLHYSEGIRKLINSMLNIKPQKRPSIDQILKNPFIQKTLQKLQLKQLGQIKDVQLQILLTPKKVQNKLKIRQKVIEILQLNNLQYGKRYLASPDLFLNNAGNFVLNSDQISKKCNSQWSPIKTPQYKKFRDHFDPVFNSNNIKNNYNNCNSQPRVIAKPNLNNNEYGQLNKNLQKNKANCNKQCKDKVKTSQKNRPRHQKSQSCITPKVRKNSDHKNSHNYNTQNQCKKNRSNYSLWQFQSNNNENVKKNNVNKKSNKKSNRNHNEKDALLDNIKDFRQKKKDKNLSTNQMFILQLDGIKQRSQQKSQQEYQNLLESNQKLKKGRYKYNFQKIDSVNQLKKPLSMRSGRVKSQRFNLSHFNKNLWENMSFSNIIQDSCLTKRQIKDKKEDQSNAIFETPQQTLEKILVSKIGRQTFEIYSKQIQKSFGLLNRSMENNKQFEEIKGMLSLWYGIKSLKQK